MEMQVMDTITTIDIVSPKFCLQLQMEGLTDKVPYFFIRSYQKDEYHLNSFAFDVDGYYRASLEAIIHNDSLQKPQIIPAYRLREIEFLIPDHLVEKKDGIYKIMLDTAYGDLEHYGIRLPDVYANLLISCIKKRILQVEHLNRALSF